MLSGANAFSGFSVDDLPKAAAFYRDTLGLDVKEGDGMLRIELAHGAWVLAYLKPNHVPATFTILNFKVDDVEQAVDDLVERGVTMTRFAEFDQDARGIVREGGPYVAWFTDPAGNVLSVLQDR